MVSLKIFEGSGKIFVSQERVVGEKNFENPRDRRSVKSFYTNNDKKKKKTSESEKEFLLRNRFAL